MVLCNVSDIFACEKEIENYRQQLVVYNNTYQQLQININQINNWFTVYDQQIQQYNRSIRLNIPYDAKYGTIEELDAQAVINAKRLNELRQELEELEKTKPQDPKL